MKTNTQRAGRIFSIALVVLTLLPTVLATLLGFHLSVVTSGSMRPTIKPGDVVLTKYESVGSLKAGEVILYYNTKLGTEVAHRIADIQVKSDQLVITTKGDANPVADTPVIFNQSMPIPVAKMVLPKIGYLLINLTGKLGRYAFALFAILAIGNLTYRSMKSKPKNENEIQSVPEQTTLLGGGS